MRWTRRKTAILLIVALITVPTWWLASPLFIVVHGEEAPPDGFSAIAEGTFVDGEPGHHASGRALVLGEGAGFVLRFEDFSVTNGPDIHVFLSKGARYAPGDADLGRVKATQGSSNYEVPASVDPREFAYVVIWCVPFSVQFGYAAITFP